MYFKALRMKLPTPLPFSLFGSLLLLWSVLLVMGAYAIWHYSVTPGSVGKASVSWPENIPFKPQKGRPTLVMLVHPQCPCSRASIAELGRLMAAVKADCKVLFLKPEGTAEEWEKTPLWESAARIPGVDVMADIDGRLAEVFGAETSGHVLFYGSEGELKYSGGITDSRGHEGSSTGAAFIKTSFSANDASANRKDGLTFGCPLKTPQTP